MLHNLSLLMPLLPLLGVLIVSTHKRITLPVQLLLIIVGVIFLGNYVAPESICTIYTLCLWFKECLSFILPFMVFTFVLNGILSLKKGAPLILIIMLTCIFLSNALFALLTYALVRLVLPFISGTVDMAQLHSCFVIHPFNTLELPRLISSEYALLGAIIIGLVLSVFRMHPIEKLTAQIKGFIEWILLHLFIPILPFYVLGFLLKIQYEGMLVKLAHHYSGAFVLIVTLQAIFIALFYFVAGDFYIRRARYYIVNALPSYITAFGTMSSTVTVPVTIDSAIKNSVNAPLANIAMPIMANVHLLGDSVGIPVLALVSMNLFLGIVPSFNTYLTFVFYFCTTMFAVSGIPGGAIIVMIPILIELFGFTPDMVSVITALYLLLDPFETGGNVMGDGALVIILNKILYRLGIMQQANNIQKDEADHTP